MIVIDANSILGLIGGVIGGAILIGIIYQVGKVFWEWFTEPAKRQEQSKKTSKAKQLQIKVNKPKK